MNTLRLSIAFTLRDWRAGELRLLLAALVVAVASIASVGFFVDRMRQALSLEARQLLGGDLVVASDQPLPEAWLATARANGLAIAQTVNFPSMVIAGDRPRLASVKAVSAGYPLRGQLRVAEKVNGPDAPATGVPPRGVMWADAQLVQELGTGIGTRAELGESTFTVERAITLEPDRGANFVNLAPRVMIRLDDLAATGLVQPASRVTYRMLVAGESGAVARYEAWARPQLGQGIRVESLENGRPELRSTLDRAERFLALVALLSALIAAVAIGLAARRFAERHLDGCAVLRAIGLRERRLAALLALELGWIALAGGAAGAMLGWGVHHALVAVLAPLLKLPLPPAGAWPALQAIAAGAVLLFGFGAFPFLRLAGVSPIRVLRRDLGAAGASPWIATGLAGGAFAALLFGFAGDHQLAATAIGGFAGGAAIFAAAVWALMRALAPLGRAGATFAGGASLRLALAAWSRRESAAITQTVALAVGLMALMLLTVTRVDLVDGWRRASPPDAPNRFVINIQPEQQESVREVLEQAGIRRAEIWPMVRGRLVSVNGRKVRPEDYASERAQRLVDREFNLSYMDALPAHNRVVAGRWFAPGSMEASVESGILGTLGLALGDELGFEIGGETRVVRATSVRKLDWDSMRVNFFMILSPKALDGTARSFITAYHQPEGRAPLEGALVQRMPNLTVFDMSALLAQVQAMLDQVVLAVQFLFVLTLAAGVVVLYTALAASRDERVREAGLMRALGASRAQLARAQTWELGLSGGLAGLLAAAGALAIGAVLARQVFQFDFDPRWSSLLWGTAAGAAVAIGAGWLGLRGVLNSPPLATLRAA
ncbi:MAG: FtsX-like permease family protein [Burkholderiaceae bacterium]